MRLRFNAVSKFALAIVLLAGCVLVGLQLASSSPVIRWQPFDQAPSGLAQQFRQDLAARLKEKGAIFKGIEFGKVQVRGQPSPLYLISVGQFPAALQRKMQG